MKYCRTSQGARGVSPAALIAGCAQAQTESDLAGPGGAVKLVVGYQPYHRQACSGVVMRVKRFYKKHLPKGSEVEFQIGIKGPIIMDNMLAGRQNIGYNQNLFSNKWRADNRLV